MPEPKHETYVDAWNEFIEKTTPLLRDYYKKEEEFFLSEARENAVVLDLGCGEGRFTKLLAEKVKKVIAIDIDSSVLETAKKRATGMKNVEFFQENALRTNFQDSYFDCVFAPDLIANLADKKVAAIKEMCRIVKPKGKIYLTAYSENALPDRLQSYKNADVTYKIVDEEKGFLLLDLSKTAPNHPSEQFSKEDLLELCRQAGQTKVEIKALNKVAYICIIDVQK